MGLIWFSLGLGGEILRAWKGNTISDPLLNIFWEDERFWNLMSLQRLSMLALHVWYRWQASWVSAEFLKCFVGKFPSYMGIIWFSLGLGGGILRAWKGNTISDPLSLISSKKMGVSETLYQLKAFNILCWHMLALDSWYHWKSSMLGALCIGWVSVTFDVVRRGVPSYMGLIWYSQSLAREIFLILKGNTISDPFPRYFLRTWNS